MSLVALANVGSVLVLLGGFRDDTLSDIATRVGAAFNIPVMFGAIALVHWGRWNFVPTETHPMGGMEFQVTLVLVMLYLVITGKPGHTPDRCTAGTGLEPRPRARRPSGRRDAFSAASAPTRDHRLQNLPPVQNLVKTSRVWCMIGIEAADLTRVFSHWRE